MGQAIPYDQPQLLCAKCHGPVYRDWQHGSHGRTNGYWNASMGPMERRKCTECHDPHQPPFPPMTPAPGPHTLRMGNQSPAEHLPEDDPLRISHDQPEGYR
jgi:predicted CXXCH cytochrome family protein